VAVKLAFATAAQPLEAEVCVGPITVELRTASNVPASRATATTISLGASPTAGFSFHSTADCSTRLDSLVIPSGASTASFYLRGELAGDVDLTASSPGLTSAVQRYQVTAPRTLAFTAFPETLVAGSCSGPVTVQRRNASGAPWPDGNAIDVRLDASPSAGFNVYLDANCRIPTLSAAILGGDSTTNFHVRGTIVGGASLTASSPRFASATRPLQVIPGPTTQLSFTTPPRTVKSGACSEPVTLESRDAYGNVTVQANELAVQLSSPSGQLTFFSDAGCAVPLSTVSILAGQSTVHFHFKGALLGTYALVTSVGEQISGQQAQTVEAGPASRLDFGTAAHTVLASACAGPVTVRSEDAAGNLSPPPADLPLTLSSVPSQGVTFYADASCTSPVAEVTLPASSGQVDFYFKALSGGVVSLTATSSTLGSKRQDQVVRSTVRTGSCSMGTNAYAVDCTIDPPLFDTQRSFLLFQATNGSNAPTTAIIRCTLGSPSTVRCTRAGVGVATDIQWQTAEFPSGVRVQHLNDITCTGPETLVPIQPVTNPDETFLLFSLQQGGTSLSSDDFFSVRLEGNDQVRIATGTDCHIARFALQVVQFPGARVTRGVTSALFGTNLEVTGLASVDTSRTVLLYTFRINDSGNDVCNRMLRGRMNSNNTLQFTRGLGTIGSCTSVNIDAISWERIELPVGTLVQQLQVDVADGAALAPTPLTQEVDLTRTLAFSGGQWLNGQGGGEGTFAGDDIFGTATGFHQLTSPSELEVTRGSAQGYARWTPYILQLLPQ
jgi:hypothetical protein